MSYNPENKAKSTFLQWLRQVEDWEKYFKELRASSVDETTLTQFHNFICGLHEHAAESTISSKPMTDFIIQVAGLRNVVEVGLKEPSRNKNLKNSMSSRLEKLREIGQKI